MKLKSVVTNGVNEPIFFLSDEKLNLKINELKYKVDPEYNHFSVRSYSKIQDGNITEKTKSFIAITRNGAVYEIFRYKKNAEKRLQEILNTMDIEWNNFSIIKFQIII